MRVLNLYAGIGGNRKLWEGVDVTAVENDWHIASVYNQLYPQDTVVVNDAHQYLLEHFREFDFIWASPPCPTHGQYRYNVGVRAKGYAPVYPDMKLYEEIVFLRHYFTGKWVVENVKPYYVPLVPPIAELQRHLFWSNFAIAPRQYKAKGLRAKNKISDYDDLPDISNSKIKNKRQVLRNCVDAELGLYVLQEAMRPAATPLTIQL